MRNFLPNNRINLDLPASWPILGTGILGSLVLAGLLLTQSPFVVIGVVVAVAALVGVSRWPEWGLYGLVLSVPGQSYLALSLGSSRVTLTQATFGLALVGWLGSRVLTRQPFLPRPLPRLLPFFGIYLAVMVVSISVAQDTGAALEELSRWLITFFAYLLATSVIKSRRQIWGLVVCLCAGAIIEGVIGAIQNRLSSGPEDSLLPCVDVLRACGTFIMPNSYAAYVEMGLPLLVAIAFMAWGSRNEFMRRWFALDGQPRDELRPTLWRRHGWLLLLFPAIGLAGLGILTAQSKGAFLGLAAATLAMTVVQGRKAIPLVIAGGVALFLVVAGVQTGVIAQSAFGRLVAVDQFTPFDVRDVTVTDDNFSTVERMAMWQAGGNMFLSDPWLGVGIGNYNARYFEFSTPRWPDSRGHAHNYYIQAAAETGLVGAVAYLFLLLAGIGQGWRTVRRTADPRLRYVAWGAFGIIIAVAFHNIVEDLHVLNMGIQWSAVLALFYVIEEQPETELVKH